MTAAYQYDLTYLRRGVYGTPVNAHSAGSNFARFGPNDPSLFRYRYPGNFVGQTIHVKLPAFNIFGQSLQDLSTLTADTYVLTGAGAVASVTVPIQYLGIPQATQPIARYTFGEAVSFAANLAGSFCTGGTVATAAQIMDIAKNGTNFGTGRPRAPCRTGTRLHLRRCVDDHAKSDRRHAGEYSGISPARWSNAPAGLPRHQDFRSPGQP